MHTIQSDTDKNREMHVFLLDTWGQWYEFLSNKIMSRVFLFFFLLIEFFHVFHILTAVSLLSSLLPPTSSLPPILSSVSVLKGVGLPWVAHSFRMVALTLSIFQTFPKPVVGLSEHCPGFPNSIKNISCGSAFRTEGLSTAPCLNCGSPQCDNNQRLLNIQQWKANLKSIMYWMDPRWFWQIFLYHTRGFHCSFGSEPVCVLTWS